MCAGSSTTLTASGGASYAWSSGEKTAAISKSTAGTYTVTVTNANNCSATASQTLTFLTPPVAVINGATSFCQGGSVALTAAGGASYAWSSGETTAAITKVTGGTFTVTVTGANGCTSTASQIVTATPLPNTTLTGPSSFCTNTNFSLIASGGNTYAWSSGENTASIIKTTAGTYTVTITGAGGCMAVQSQTVTSKAAPVASITGASGFCPSGSATFTAAGGASYAWASGETTAAVTKNVAGTYTVTVTAANGCNATASQVIVANTNPKVVVTESKKVFCQGDTALLTVSGGGTYLWDNGTTGSTVTVKASGTYKVTVTNAGGCTAIGSDSITVNPTPTAASSVSVVCSGSPATTFTAPAGAKYRWSSGDTTASVVVSNAGAYTVTVTSSMGCVGVIFDTLKVNAKPKAAFVVSIVNNKITFANNSTGGSRYQWFFGDPQASVSTQISPVFVYPSIGAFTATLIVTSDLGCSDTLTQSVNVVTSVQDIAKDLNVAVYPNPITNQVTVEFRNAHQVFGSLDELFITNLMGQRVYTEKLASDKTTINTSDWANGVYLLNAKVNGKTVSFSKVVKIN